MKVKLVLAVLFCVIMLLLSACDEYYEPDPILISNSVNADGSDLRIRDNRLFNSNWGNPVYISEIMVLHIGNKVYSRALGSNIVRQLIPDNLQVTDKVNYDLDMNEQRLYVAINNHIYSLKFDGSELTDHSPATTDTLSCPVLSEDGNYLTALSNGKIKRLDLQSGVWQDSPVPHKAEYAVYISQTDTYYYYTDLSAKSSKAFWSWEVSTADTTRIMELEYVYHDRSLVPGLSRDRRYMALYMASNGSYGGLLGDFKLYDRLTNQVTTIPAVYAYSFSLTEPKLYYSRSYKGMADLKLLELETGIHSLIWDGFYNQTNYSRSLTQICPRADGAHVFFNGYQRFISSSRSDKVSGL
ncbi:MAG: hypothetical protein V3576_00545 [Candidatus Cloacimonadota bacterium]